MLRLVAKRAERLIPQNIIETCRDTRLRVIGQSGGQVFTGGTVT
jgi:hypothetical protein